MNSTSLDDYAVQREDRNIEFIQYQRFGEQLKLDSQLIEQSNEANGFDAMRLG